MSLLRFQLSSLTKGRKVPGSKFKYGEIFCRARSNAVKRGIEFVLTSEEFKKLVIRANDCCMVSGIQFSDKYVKAGDRGKKRPFAPSLDRINSSKGYTKENCRLVCVIVNLAMNEWGEEPLLELCRAMHQYEKPADPVVEIETDKSYETAKEYLRKTSKHLRFGKSLSFRAARMCRAKGLEIKTRAVPVYQRKDFSWYFQTVKAYPKTILWKCLKQMEKESHSVFCNQRATNLKIENP